MNFAYVSGRHLVGAFVILFLQPAISGAGLDGKGVEIN